MHMTKGGARGQNLGESEHDQKIPNSYTADQPKAPRGRATER